MNKKKIIKKWRNFLRRKKRKTSIIRTKSSQHTLFRKRKQKQLKIQFSFLLSFFQTLRNIPLFIYIFAMLGFIILVVAVLLFSPIFQVKTIFIQKQDGLTNIDIAYKSIDKFRGKNVLQLNKDSIEKSIKKYQQNIENVDINIQLPDKIDITIGSYEEFFHTLIQEKEYAILKNGSLIPTANKNNTKKITIKGKIDQQIIEYKQVFSPKHIQALKYLFEKTSENIIGIQIKEFLYYAKEREAHLTLENDNIIIFDLEENLKSQIKKLAAYTADMQNILKEKIVYIDLRIKDKIYVCGLESEYNCRVNLKSIYGE